MKKIVSSFLARLSVCGMILALVVGSDISKAQSWATLGSVGFTVNNAVFTSIALDGSGMPYVAYTDGGSSSKASVMKYNGSNWATVGSAGFTAGQANYVFMALDGSGTPYVAYKDVANGNKASVMKYNGSSWVQVGSAAFSAGTVNFTSIAIDGSGTPYVLYQDGASSGKATVMKYNGSSWVTVGSAAFSASTALYCCIAIDGSGTPYVVYRDAGAGTKATVKKFDGTSWVTVGSAGFTAGRANYTYIAIDASGTPYVAYCDFPNSNKASVMKFDGTSWVAVGSIGFSAGTVFETSIAIDPSGKPYVVYVDGANSNKATVMKFDGTSWNVVGSAGISGGATDFTRIAINSSGTPYIAFNDQSHVNGGATAMTYGTASSIAPITGTATLCAGTTTTLNDSTAGGTWSSSATAVATVDSTGVVTGISGGTATISYTVAGSSVTKIVTVSPLPSAGTISGTTSLCVGGTTTLTSSVTGGVWSSSSAGATVDSSGIVTGVSAGTTGITYMVFNSCGVATVSATVTVNSAPSSAGTITGPSSVLVGAVITLSDFTPGGVWSSSNPSIGTIGATGIVTGIAAGTTLISYTVSNSCGSQTATRTITVNTGCSGTPTPGTASASVSSGCVGYNTVLTLTGASSGSGITYQWAVSTDGGTTWSNVTGATSTTYSTSVSTPVQYRCLVGCTVSSLSATSNALTLSTSAPSVTYASFPFSESFEATWINSCATRDVPTANWANVPSSGNNSWRRSDDITSGGWTSPSNGVYSPLASAGSNSARFHTYFVSSGVSGKLDLYINLSSPVVKTISYAAINTSGSDKLRLQISTDGGANFTTLDSVGIAATWTTRSVNTSATSATTVIRFLATSDFGVTDIGLDNVTVTTATYCTASFGDPGASCASYGIWGRISNLTGSSGVISDALACNSTGYQNRTALSCSMAAGSSYTAYLATGQIDMSSQIWIDFNDDFTFQSSESVGGNASYSYSGSPFATITIPACATSGTHRMRMVSNYTACCGGFVYPSIPPCPGTAITYGECRDYTVTISGSSSTLPSITGSTTVCIGTPGTLSNSTTGGTWSSSNTTVATIGSGTGVVTGVAPGTTNITYTVAGACGTMTVATTVTVNATPVAGTISGTTTVCAGGTTSLSSSVGGGTWSSTTAAATVNSSGVVTGMSGGTAIIIYTVSNSCGSAIATVNVTVTPGASAGTITGASTVVIGSTITLSDTASGGAWSSSNPAIATVSGGGVVTGIAAGSVTISYTVTGSCGAVSATTVIMVTSVGGSSSCNGWMTVGSPLAPEAADYTDIAIDGSGTPYVVFADFTYGSKASVKKFTGTGWVSVGSPGFSVNYIYTSSIAIDASGTPYVAYADGGIAGKIAVKKFDGTSWVNVGTSGFSVGDVDFVSIAIDPSGYPCVAYEDYGNSSRPTVKKFNGTSWVNFGSTAEVSSGIGAYTSLAIDGTGTPYVTYQDGATSNRATVKKFNGASWVVVGTAGFSASTATYTSITVDNTGKPYVIYRDASISNKATVKSFNGSTWSTVGTTGFSTGAAAYTSITTNASAVPYVVYQDGSMANRATVRSFDGSSWVSVGSPSVTTSTAGTPAIAIDGSGTPYVAFVDGSIANNVSVAKYGTGAFTPIVGTATLCSGSTVTFTNATSGGTWTSSSPFTASVGSATGIVSALGTGTATISYTSGSCVATQIVSVNTAPNAGSVSGASVMCVGATASLTSTVSGGTWSSSNTSVATVGTGGVVTAVASGTANIIYTVMSPCGITGTATAMVTVNAVAAITGSTSVAVGGTTSLSHVSPGGVWSSSSPAVASVNTSGVVTGILSGGMVTISYMLPTGCFATIVVTVSSGADSLPCGTPIISTVAGAHFPPGFSGDGGPATAAQMIYPSGVKVDAAGNIYIADRNTSRVRKVNTSGIIVTIAGNGTDGGGGDGGAATAAELSAPTDIALDASGNMYISEGHRIRKVDASGIITTIAGAATSGYAGDGGPATAARFTWPAGLDVDGAGNLYIADQNNNAIRKISTSGIITTVAGTGTAGFSGDGSAATAAQLSGPQYLDVDAAGNIYISDRGNMRIRKVNTSGTISTIAGNGTAGWAGDGGLATAAQLHPPDGVCVNNTGNVFICVMGGSSGTPQRIRKINTSGIISTYAGTSTSGYSGNGGPATAGTLFAPYGITADAAGNIYFGEKNAVVRKVGCPVTCSVAAIVGSSSLCVGATVSLTDSTTGGVWSSSNSAVATVGSATGIVSGISAGTATIDYVVGSCTVSKIVTVNANPAVFTLSGGGAYCSDSVSLTLSGSQVTVGYQLFNGFTAVGAAVGGTGSSISFGPITASGTYNVWAYSASGCAAFMGSTSVTVYSSPAAIVGPSTICTGVATTLTDSVTGGVWMSSDTSVATIGFTNGVVIGATAGTTMITYMLPTGCFTTMLLAVNPSPDAGTISGPSSVIAGDSITLTPSVGGGVWSAGNSNASVSASGVVTGIAAGSVVISYSVTNSCGTAVATWTVTINALIPTVTGTQTLCVNSTTSLTGSPSGGTWSSSNVAIGTVSSSGVVTGIGAGVVNITYNVSGINTVVAVTVNALPTPITGVVPICANATATLSSTPAGGTWSSLDPSVATIGPSSNILAGVSAGTDTIVYTLSTGCSRFVVATINTTPAATLSGPSAVCIGSSISLTNAVTGGAYNSSNGAIASVTSNTVTGTGTVTGVSAGTVLISYTIGSCRTTKTVSVIANPPAITGLAKACPGTTTALTNTVTGGTWSSSNTAVATVDSLYGIVTGVMAGNATIIYTAPSGCTKSVVVTINATPTISGTLAICPSTTTNLTSSPAASSWSSSTPSVATIAGSGLVTATSTPGTTTITVVASGTGCTASTVFTVNPPPPAIGGTLTTCPGGTTLLTNAVGGGTWSSATPGVASINASGLVTGIAAGNATISYSLGGGCVRTAIVTVSALPTIAGSPIMCVNASIPLAGTPAGGTWSSANPSTATVSASGVVTGAAAGTTNIIYTALTGCSRTIVATINTSPGAFSGTTSVCMGTTSSLSNAVGGGTWSSTNTGVATIGLATGVLTGVAAGTSTISYRIGTCGAAIVVNVMPLPAVITGLAKACPGTTTSLTDATTGGTWSSANPSIGSVDATSGVVTGVTPGTTLITYTAPNSCVRSATVTINPNPNPITGTLSMCVGASSSLSCSSPVALSWTSSDPGKASVNSSGVVTGVAGGTANITYTVTTGCFTTTMVNINTAPTPITGSLTACTGATTTLSNATPGGTWFSSNPSIAPIDTNGVVTGIVAGPTVVTYGFGGGCSVSVNVTVLTGASPITGTAAVCAGTTMYPYLTATGSGTWSSSDTSIATVPSTHGGVNGIAAGTAYISFTIANGCASTRQVTVSVCPPRGMISSTGVGQQNVDLGISLYPNPTTGTFVINTREAGTLGIYSLEGKEVMKQDVKPGTTELNLPANLTTGVYMCRFNDNLGTIATVRLVYTKE